MSPFLWVVIYITTWAVSVFFVIPFYTHVDPNKRAEDYAAAPAKPNIRKILKANTLLATAIVLVLYLLIHFQLLTMPEV